MLPLLIGFTVGAVGDNTFVLANAPGFGSPESGVALTVWVVLAFGWMAATLFRRHTPVGAPPERHTFLVYGESVMTMLALLRATAAVLDGRKDDHLPLATTSLAGGLHFLPFAWASPRPRDCSGLEGRWSLCSVVPVCFSDCSALGGWGAAAVLAGPSTLALIAVHSLRHRRHRVRPRPGAAPPCRMPRPVWVQRSGPLLRFESRGRPNRSAVGSPPQRLASVQ